MKLYQRCCWWKTTVLSVKQFTTTALPGALNRFNKLYRRGQPWIGTAEAWMAMPTTMAVAAGLYNYVSLPSLKTTTTAKVWMCIIISVVFNEIYYVLTVINCTGIAAYNAVSLDDQNAKTASFSRSWTSFKCWWWLGGTTTCIQVIRVETMPMQFALSWQRYVRYQQPMSLKSVTVYQNNIELRLVPWLNEANGLRSMTTTTRSWRI